MHKLDALFTSACIHEHHYKTLKIIYILAYRTGMRLNEILDCVYEILEGLTNLSVWIQPYGSKTYLFKRNETLFIKTDEYQLFHSHVIEQRLLKQKLILISQLE